MIRAFTIILCVIVGYSLAIIMLNYAPAWVVFVGALIGLVMWASKYEKL